MRHHLTCKMVVPACTENRVKFVSDYTSHTCVCRYPYNDDVKPYAIYGATISEVEIDLLTGRYQVSSAFVFTAGCVYICFNVVLPISTFA